MNCVSKLSRRRVLRGMMGGGAITVGLPFLDCFLDSNGAAQAATGAPLPVCFGTWFHGCGLNPGRWEPKTVGPNYEFGVELQPLTRQDFRAARWLMGQHRQEGAGGKP